MWGIIGVVVQAAKIMGTWGRNCPILAEK